MIFRHESDMKINLVVLPSLNMVGYDKGICEKKIGKPVTFLQVNPLYAKKDQKDHTLN